MAIAVDASDRLERFQQLADHLSEIFEPASLLEWMHEPHHYFGNATPAESLANGQIKRVEQLLIVIDDGIFT